MSGRDLREMAERVNLLIRSDLAAAGALAAEMAAQDKLNLLEQGLALRAEAIVLWAGNRFKEAYEKFRAALDCFAAGGELVEAARTRSNAIQTLIYLSRYDEALTWAAEARKVFEQEGEWLRLARLEGNVANLLYRQDRFAEAIAVYEKIEQLFLAHGEPRDVAAVLRNKAVCQLSMSAFEAALKTHEQARSYCLAQGMTGLVAEADYNIAYMYYLRGEYLEAGRLYGQARRNGDPYHRALCDLDEAEMNLELNLWHESADLAERARRAFLRLKMGYEAAKAQVFLALAHGRGDRERALRLLARARRAFERENNAVWPALIDLYAALLLDYAGGRPRARRRALRALGFFSQTVMPSKAIQCRLLLARIDLEQRNADGAAAHLAAAQRMLPHAQSPLLAGHLRNAEGRLAELHRNPDQAAVCYAAAEAAFEGLRDRLGHEHLKISFFEDKTEAYEAHFRILIEQGQVGPAFSVAERSKSRNLLTVAPPRPSLRPAFSAERNAVERQIEIASRDGKPAPWIDRLRERLLDLPRQQTPPPPPSLEAVEENLPGGTMLLEYFQCAAELYALMVGGGRRRVIRLGPAARIVESLRYLNFQLGLAARQQPPGEEATALAGRHLRRLGELLVAPLGLLLTGPHLVIVPHGILHGVPFHALFDGEGYLGDRFTISVAPSAAIYLRCCRRRKAKTGGACVFGVGDLLAPQIRSEARLVASLLPGAPLYLDEEATIARLRQGFAGASHLHIATHARFRQDNPWFSALVMGDGELNLYDLYELQTAAELVVLSGCSTGLSVVRGGDEPVGLIRGLLHAGVKAAVVSLWNVHDETTQAFMQHFYEQALQGVSFASALQLAQRKTRQSHPHPFHWAAFQIVGADGSLKK